jgi:hypothetical protein
MLVSISLFRSSDEPSRYISSPASPRHQEPRPASPNVDRAGYRIKPIAGIFQPTLSRWFDRAQIGFSERRMAPHPPG